MKVKQDDCNVQNAKNWLLYGYTNSCKIVKYSYKKNQSTTVYVFLVSSQSKIKNNLSYAVQYLRPA